MRISVKNYSNQVCLKQIETSYTTLLMFKNLEAKINC
jgi:hypothetical protein